MSAGFLLDTSALSLLAPGKPVPPAAFAAWLRQHNDQLYVSAITVAEIEQGICKLKRAGSTARANDLSHWLESILSLEESRILPFDARVGRIAGALSDLAVAKGRHPGFADVAIAATAKAHNLVLLSCNGKHFEPLGVECVDPVDSLSDRGHWGNKYRVSSTKQL